MFGNNSRSQLSHWVTLLILILRIGVLGNILNNRCFPDPNVFGNSSRKQLVHWVNLCIFVLWIAVFGNILKNRYVFGSNSRKKLAHRINLSIFYITNCSSWEHVTKIDVFQTLNVFGINRRTNWLIELICFLYYEV